jgi:hypothetical protein
MEEVQRGERGKRLTKLAWSAAILLLLAFLIGVRITGSISSSLCIPTVLLLVLIFMFLLSHLQKTSSDFWKPKTKQSGLKPRIPKERSGLYTFMLILLPLVILLKMLSPLNIGAEILAAEIAHYTVLFFSTAVAILIAISPLLFSKLGYRFDQAVMSALFRFTDNPVLALVFYSASALFILWPFSEIVSAYPNFGWLGTALKAVIITALVASIFVALRKSHFRQINHDMEDLMLKEGGPPVLLLLFPLFCLDFFSFGDFDRQVWAIFFFSLAITMIVDFLVLVGAILIALINLGA